MGAVVHPNHYNTDKFRHAQCGKGIECFDVTDALNFNIGNVVKYIWRAGEKETSTKLEDLQKAREYLNREIQRLESLEDHE